MSKNSSLTAPHDRDPNLPMSADQSVVLTEEQVVMAKQENLDKSFIEKFPHVEKYFADPIYNNQTFCLHSFIPSKGASPDEEGVFGFMKCRGAFQSQAEADARGEWIIRNVDSYHPIQTCYMGRPFPVCVDARNFTAETSEVDIRKKAIDTLSQNIKAKKEDEQREMKEIKEREQKLLAESKEDYEPEPIDKYTTLRVKKANLEWTYFQTSKKMDEMKNNILKTRKEITEMDNENSEYKEQYYEKYMSARRESGLDDSKMDDNDNFTRYLCEDLDLGF